MYVYTLSISMAEKKLPISDEFIEVFKDACNQSNNTLNSKRNGRKFTYVSRIGDDNLHIKVLLESQTSVIPTRAISSITRALLKSSLSDELSKHVYKGCIITASVIDEPEPTFKNMDKSEILQTVIEIFLGNLPSNTEKDNAKIAAERIREIVIDYKQKSKP